MKPPKLDLDRTRERLLALSLVHAADQLDTALSEAVKASASSHQFIDSLLQAEISAREARRVKTALRLSSLPTGQTLAEFDFAFPLQFMIYRLPLTSVSR